MTDRLRRTRWTLRLIFASLIVFARISTMEAATITVTNTNSDGDGSLRQAVIDASAGDTIQFDLPVYPATIFLAAGEIASSTRTSQFMGRARIS